MIDSLGIEVVSSGPMGDNIKRNEPFGETNIKGVFAAGETGTPLKQVTIAMSTGALAAAGISTQLCTEEGERLLATAKGTSVGNVEVKENGRY